MKMSACGCGLAVFLFLVGFFTSPVFADYGGGGGMTPDDPYLISEPEHLLAIGSHREHWGRFFKLTADIDLSEYEWTSANFIGINWGDNNHFFGTFDGDGHTISHLSYTAAAGNYVGLFGCVKSGTVRNLNLEVTLDLGTCNYVGGLVGLLTESGRLENCHVQYAITVGDSRQFIGGLAGQANLCIITDCSSRGTLTVGKGSFQVGGLVGLSWASIVNCHSSGTIVTVGTGISSHRIGGLVGEHEGQAGPIENCWSDCSIVPGGSAYAVGGLVGRHRQGDITNCFSTGAVQGSTQVGGLIGASQIAEDAYGTISHCYSTGDVTASSGSAGGLAGYTERATMTDCASSGRVTASVGAQQVGGLVGGLWQLSRVTDCSSSSAVTVGANASYIGGLAGLCSGSPILRSCSRGPVVCGGGQNATGIGGLAGVSSEVIDCYSLSSVDGGPDSRQVGGLVGQIYTNTVERCFSAGAVQSGGTLTGGLIGDGTGAVIGCYWDKETSGQLTSAGGKGMTTKAMQSASTFTLAGWDLTDTWKMYDYPGLAWEPEIGIHGDLSVSIAEGEKDAIYIDVFCLRNAALNWQLEDHDNCGWIAKAAPTGGTSAGPGDVTTIRLMIDSAGLAVGDYTHELAITGDNGETRKVPLTLRVFHRVKQDALAPLSTYWQVSGCDFGQPCKAVDWYADGVIDVRDLMLLADGWLGEDIAVVKPTIEEGFESGDFSQLSWEHGGDAPWTITNESYEGNWAVKSGLISDGQSSVLEVTLDLTGWEVDTLWFAWKTSCESGYDTLRFYIDDVEQLNRSGIDGGYQHYVYPGGISLIPGVRTFKWVYSKDASDAAGLDCAWIDSIRIYKR